MNKSDKEIYEIAIEKLLVFTFNNHEHYAAAYYIKTYMDKLHEENYELLQETLKLEASLQEKNR